MDDHTQAQVEAANYRHLDPLDGQQVPPPYPVDSAADYVLDEIAHKRDEFIKLAGLEALATIKKMVSEAVEKGLAEWKKHEGEEQSAQSGESIAEVLRLVMQLRAGDGNVAKSMTGRQAAMSAEALLYVIGRTNKSLQEIGETYGYTRANVSAVVVKYKKRLGLKKTRAMKSEEAVKSYRVSASLAHQRNNKEPKPCPTNKSFKQSWKEAQQTCQTSMPVQKS